MEFALNAMRNAGPGAQAMSLTPDREGQEGNTLACLPPPSPYRNDSHTAPDLEDQEGNTPHPSRQMLLCLLGGGEGLGNVHERCVLARRHSATRVQSTRDPIQSYPVG